MAGEGRVDWRRERGHEVSNRGKAVDETLDKRG